MNNELYIKKALETYGVPKLSEEQKRSLSLKMKAYLDKSAEIGKKREELLGLEKDLKESIPFIKVASEIHRESGIGGCGMKTAFRIGSCTGGEPVYYCVNCEADFQF